MSWSTFTATYAPSAGPLRLGHWQCADTDRLATRLGTRTFRATLALGDRIETATATATGPVAALTAMLYEHGVSVEMLRFHQLQSDDTTATFIQGTDGCRPSGRWVARKIRRSRPCRRSSPARTGCSREPDPLEAAQHDRHAVHRDRHAAVVPDVAWYPGRGNSSR